MLLLNAALLLIALRQQGIELPPHRRDNVHSLLRLCFLRPFVGQRGITQGEVFGVVQKRQPAAVRFVQRLGVRQWTAEIVQGFQF